MHPTAAGRRDVLPELLPAIRCKPLFRAFAEPRNTLRLEAAARKLEALAASGVRATQQAELLPLRQGAIREAVIEVLSQADEALAPLEIRRRAASRIGRPVKQHTVTAALGLLARDPEVPIARTGPARYALVDDAKAAMPLTPRMEAIGARVLGILAAASEPMRPAQVWTAVEAQHGERIAYDTVAGFLSLAAKHPKVPVARVRKGLYRTHPS